MKRVIHSCTTIVLFLSVVLLLSQTVVAADFEVNIEAIDDDLTVGESTHYVVSVTNNGGTQDEFNLYTDNDLWELRTDPLYLYLTQYGLTVGNGQTSSFDLHISPFTPKTPGLYKVNLYVQSKKNPKQIIQKSITVTVRGGSTVGEYLPAVRADAYVSDNGKVDPREEAVLYLKLDNLNPLNISDLKIYIEGTLFNAERTTTLGPLEQKTETFQMEFDDLEPPKKETLSVNILRGSEVVKNIKAPLEIIAYSQLKQDKHVKNGLFSKTTSYTFMNDGNVEKTEKILIPTEGIAEWFTSSTPKKEITESEGTTYLTYYLTLEPQGTGTVEVRENYQPLVLAIILIILSIIGYYKFRSPVIMKKNVMILGKKHGKHGVSELKVLLYIKNRTARQFKRIKVLDKIPTIAEMKDEFIVGTLKPTKVIRNEKRGTIIEWEAKTIEPWEERIISYRIKSKLNILGLFNLPPAMVKFKEGMKERKVLSNKVRAMSDK